VAVSRSVRHAVFGSAITFAACASCTSLLGIETTELQQPDSSTPAAVRICETPESTLAPDSAQGAINVTFLDFRVQTPSTGISVNVCNSFNDTACTQGSYAGCGLSDSQGNASVNVPFDTKNLWTGYLLVTAPEHETFYYFFPSPISGAKTPYVIPHFLALKTADFKWLQTDVLKDTNALNAPIAAGRGQITVNVLNPDGSRRSDEVLELYLGGDLVTSMDEGVTQFYLQNMGGQGVPVVSAKQTDDTGFGGFLNVKPATLYTVRMRNKDSPGVYDGEIPVFVVADTWSTMDLTPNLLSEDAGSEASAD
jgi:hypothetical protein